MHDGSKHNVRYLPIILRWSLKVAGIKSRIYGNFQKEIIAEILKIKNAQKRPWRREIHKSGLSGCLKVKEEVFYIMVWPIIYEQGTINEESRALRQWVFFVSGWVFFASKTAIFGQKHRCGYISKTKIDSHLKTWYLSSGGVNAYFEL